MTTRHRLSAALLASFALLAAPFAVPLAAQESPEPDSARGARTARSVKSVDDLAGIHYYIKIVEHDTSWQSKMPVTSPAPGFTVANIQPVPMKRVQPRYPQEARASGARGSIWLKARIGADGIVREVKVMKSESDFFVKPAMEAVKQWIFNPAMYDGKPIDVWAAIPFTFEPAPPEVQDTSKTPDPQH